LRIEVTDTKEKIMQEFQGKVAIVTGTTGIGEAIAK